MTAAMPNAAAVVTGIRLIKGVGVGDVPRSMVVVAPHTFVKTTFVS